jgi:hypothetical protein
MYFAVKITEFSCCIYKFSPSKHLQCASNIAILCYYYSKKNIAMHTLSDDHESKSMPEANFQVLVLFKNVTGVT